MYVLLAYNQFNELIEASEVEKNCHNQYFCPGCNEKVFVKQGMKVVPHFSHYKHSDCQTFSEGESEEHIQGKLFLYNFLKPYVDSIEIEPYIRTLKQRPDLLLTYNNQKVAIEFQCSPISVKQIVKRSQGYQKSGILVLWIIGSPLQLDKRLSQLHRAMMNDIVFTTPNLLYLDTKKERLVIHYHFQKSDQTKWKTSQLIQFVLNKNLPVQIPKSTNSIQYYSQKMIKQLHRMHYYKTKNIRNFFQVVYQEGDHLLSLPQVIFIPCYSEWSIMTASYEWKYYLYKWIERMKSGTVITTNLIKQWFLEQIETNKIKIYAMPNINRSFQLNCIIYFIEILSSENILISKRSNKWYRY